MCVLCTKVNVPEVFFAVQGGTYTFGSQSHFEVCPVVDDHVEGVCKALHLVGVANYLNHLFLFWLEDAVPLDDLPDAFLVLGEGRVLCVDLRFVGNLDFLATKQL